MIVSSIIGTIVFLGIIVPCWILVAPAHPGRFSSWSNLIPLLLPAGSALFVVRGYSIETDSVIVHGLFWRKRMQLADLRSTELWFGATRGNISISFLGGLLPFAGYHHNHMLGYYRCFATDSERTVVLRFPGRAIVLSPERPEDFVQELSSLLSRR